MLIIIFLFQSNKNIKKLKNKNIYKSNHKISNHNSRVKSGFIIPINDRQKITKHKTGTMRLHHDTNSLIQKYQIKELKFKSFLNDKKSKNKFNINRDFYNNIVKQQKNKSLFSNKKSITSNNLNNKIIKKKNKNNIKNIYKNKEITNNFHRNNKSMNPPFLDDDQNNSNYINRSNYKIKVKTKINQNEKELLVKNFNKLNYKNDINGKNIFNDNCFTDLLINPKYYKRHQHSNNITKKHIKLFKDYEQEEILLDKIKFLQLWWKTIFQIIKIQKHMRGFLYRKKLIEELDREEIAVDNLLFFIKSYKKIVFKIFINKLKNFKPGINYYFNKWNEKIKKTIIINKLINLYNKNINKNIKLNLNNYNDINKTNIELMKIGNIYDKNYFIRDSTHI